MKQLGLILFMLLALFVDVDSVTAQRYQRIRGARSIYWGVDKMGDSTLYISLQEIRIYHRKRDLKEYQRMVRAVKKVYPLAVEASIRMDNLDEELAKLAKRKDQKAYTKAIEDALKEEIQETSKKIYSHLGCAGLVRVDYISSEEGLYFLEVNTIPGMTSASLVPQMVRAAGMSMTDFLSTVIENA